VSIDSERARWNERFSVEHYLFGTEPNHFLASQAHRLRPGTSALAVADGEGRNGVWLAGRGLRVTTFDLSKVGVEKAQALAARQGVEIETSVADVNEWDWDARQFDLVVVVFVQFMTVPERERFFSGTVRALVPGGLLMLQGYTPKQLEYATGGPKKVEQLYTAGLLRAAFAGLEVLHLREHEEMMSEGSGHQGMGALIDLVARKPHHSDPPHRPT
jgi:2-polyprenyl-3-methyl-5-hydroxy-6-metoxy-1,4-benzoquinol methylase